MPQQRRPKDQISCPQNAPLVAYFQEQVAKKKQFGNEPVSFAYSKALKSIRNCPIPILSGKHAREIKLEGIGPAMEKQIDTALSLVASNFTTDSTDEEFSQQYELPSNDNPQPQPQVSLAAQLRREASYLSSINARTANLVAVEFPSTVQSLISVRCITTTEERLAEGKEYFKQKKVVSATIRENSDPNSGFEVDAFVKGSKPDPYYVVLQLDRQKTFLRSVCEECVTHPNIVGVCKHAIAVLYSCAYGTITVDNSNWKSPAAKITRRQANQPNENLPAQPQPTQTQRTNSNNNTNTQATIHQGIPANRTTTASVAEQSSDSDDNTTSKTKTKTSKKKKDYIDTIRRRSGPWAILMALYDKYPTPLNERDLKLNAQPLCDAPFERVGAIDPTQPASFYSAFSCVTKLSRERNLVKIARKPKMYSLTDDGVKFAQVLHEREYNPNYRQAPPSDQLENVLVTHKTMHAAKPTANSNSHHAETTTVVPQQPEIPVWRDLNEIPEDEDDVIDLTPTSSQITPPSSQVTPPMPSQHRQQHEVVFLDSDSEEEDEEVSDKENRNPNHPVPCVPPSQQLKPIEQYSYPSISGKTFQQQYQVVLIVDLNERFDADYSLEDLRRRLGGVGVILDQKRLSVGDYLWVARQTSSQFLDGSEIVLDFIAERKKISTFDLQSSVKDGRIQTQRMVRCILPANFNYWQRLKQSGLTSFYIMEGSNTTHCNLNEHDFEFLLAMLEFSNYRVHRTKSEPETFEWLCNMSSQIKDHYCKNGVQPNPIKINQIQSKQPINFRTYLSRPNQPSIDCFLTLDEFNEMCKKSVDIQTLFATQLYQITGISPMKAEAIVRHYPTPKSLMDAYKQKRTLDEQIKMVADIRIHAPPSTNTMRIGSALSKKVHQMFFGNKQ